MKGNASYIWSLGMLVFLYGLNVGTDVMDVDAAQYASISLEMSQNQSYLEVYHRQLDYLDKPPLLFWLSSFSFQFFGVSNWAYKLPSVLVLLLGIYATFRFARLWYGEKTALFAALIYGFAQGTFQMSNDIRTDTLLTSWVIFAIWQLSAYIQEGKWLNLLGGTVGVALAMMSKGPIGILIPGIAIGFDLLLKREWKKIWDPKWLRFMLGVALVLLRLAYGLY